MIKPEGPAVVVDHGNPGRRGDLADDDVRVRKLAVENTGDGTVTRRPARMRRVVFPQVLDDELGYPSPEARLRRDFCVTFAVLFAGLVSIGTI